MSIVCVILFLIFIVLCLVYCWGHTNGYRDACTNYRIPITNSNSNSKDNNILYPL
jgi:hypothetical protein